MYAELTQKERRKKLCKEYELRHPERVRASKAAYRERNRELLREKNRIYQRRNKKTVLARCRAYQAAKKKALPKWLTKSHRNEMRLRYLNCPKGCEVDHIIPIRGKTVSGLHVPWNLQTIPVHINRVKSNKC